MNKPELAALRVSLTEVDVQGDDAAREMALRLLARWLVAAAQKGAPARHSMPPHESQNPLEVATEAKVVSKGT
jgi:hypothetical protein